MNPALSWKHLALAPVFAFAVVVGFKQPAHGADCIVNPHSTARVGAASKGVIATILVERGDRVFKGQVMAELESSEEQSRQSLAQMRAGNETPIMAARKRAEVAETKVKRLVTLNARKVVSQAEVDDASLEAQTARYQELQAMLDQELAVEEVKAAAMARERKTVRAPFDGVVTARLLSSGEIYNEQEPILIVARIDPLHIETFLPLSERGRVRAGMTVPVDMETGVTVEGRITVIDPVLDAATGTFGVRLEAPNADFAVLAGQRCTARFD